MKSMIQGKDIYHVSINFINKSNLPLYKLVCITTDGAPAMMRGKNNGFIALYWNDNNFPNFITFHCVIYQQALCRKLWKSILKGELYF